MNHAWACGVEIAFYRWISRELLIHRLPASKRLPSIQWQTIHHDWQVLRLLRVQHRSCMHGSVQQLRLVEVLLTDGWRSEMKCGLRGELEKMTLTSSGYPPFSCPQSQKSSSCNNDRSLECLSFTMGGLRLHENEAEARINRS